MGAVNDVTEAALRELAAVRAEHDSVLSVYVDLDPSRFATAPARATEIDSLLDEAHREIESRERGHDELAALRAARDRVRQLLDPHATLMRGARALAIFVCVPAQLERAFRLPQAVGSGVFVADSPFIAPLAEVGPSGPVCVALIDERYTRILRGTGERLVEAVSFGDSVHGRHTQGGWSQARYQRSIYKDAEDHLRHTAKVLFDLLRIAPYERLLIACAEPLWPRATGKLLADVQARLLDRRLSLDLSSVAVVDVERAAAEALADAGREREDELVAALAARGGAGNGGRVAAGLPDVLEALIERRVEALLYERGMHERGFACARCGWMGVSDGACPVDGEPLAARENILDDAVAAAIAQAAEVVALQDRPELGALGRVAGLLRF